MGTIWIAWVAMGGHKWAHVMLWVGMGGHRSLLMGVVWIWVRIRRKCWVLLHKQGWRAHGHCNRRALIGRKSGDRPSSLYTRRWRPKGPKKASWMKSLHGVLHGRLWVRFRGLSDFPSGLPPRDGPDANSGRSWFLLFFQHDIIQGKFHSRFHDIQHHQVVLSNW